MPLYEFECRSCGKRMEVLQRFEDPPPAACPTCGGDLKKLFSAPAVQFKGSGFYATDYKGSPGKKEADGKSEGKAAGASEGKAEGKVEGKSEGKPEGKPDGAKKETPAPAAKTESKSSGGAAGD